jgi:pullulanase/glycogen debranching enzyme
MRNRLIKNFLLTLFISRGVPMLLGGDEFRRTQRGNNNAYCQDNEVSWFDWSLLEEHKEIQRFTRGMIAFRRAHPVLRKEEFLHGCRHKVVRAKRCRSRLDGPAAEILCVPDSGRDRTRFVPPV